LLSFLFVGTAAIVPLQLTPAIASSFRISVTASPIQVQVGHYVTVSVKGSSVWSDKSSVKVELSSTHHFINTPAKWRSRCSCFSVAIRLIPRVHPPEVARITAAATVAGTTYTGSAGTKVYGLYPNGKPEPIPTPKKPPKNYLRVSGWVYPKPSVAEQYSTLWVQTLPGSTCSAKVSFASGKAPSEFDGSPTETDGMGQANWTWFNNVSSSTAGTAVVTCDREILHGQAAIQFHMRG
jgi:hypothetical protein